MKRSSWISLVDIFAFVSFLFLIATGFLLRYILPPGSGGIEAHGTGWRASSRSVSLVWGMSRHEWGAVHFWISVLFLIAIALHLFIHWRWIAVSFKGKERQESHLQAGIGIAALIGLVLLAIALIFGPKKETTRQELQQQRDATPLSEKMLNEGP